MPSKEAREAARKTDEWVKKQTWYKGPQDKKEYIPSAEEIEKYEKLHGLPWTGPRPPGMPTVPKIEHPKPEEKKEELINRNFF